MIEKTAQWLAVSGFVLFAPIPGLAQQLIDADNDALTLAAMEQMNQQMLFGSISLVVIIVAALIFATLRDKRRRDVLARFAEKGQEIPSALLPEAPSRLRELRRATWLSSLGLGLGLVLYIATGDWRVAAWCLILLFLAAASFINATLFYGSDRTEGRTEGGK